MFLFLSLALLKRYSELYHTTASGKQIDRSRGYLAVDVDLLAMMGLASGYVTALVLGLYINSEDVKPLYKHPEIMWLICPLILYWISRMWLTARRGFMNQDPVVFMLRDKVSYLSGILAAIVIALAAG